MSRLDPIHEQVIDELVLSFRRRPQFGRVSRCDIESALTVLLRPSATRLDKFDAFCPLHRDSTDSTPGKTTSVTGRYFHKRRSSFSMVVPGNYDLSNSMACDFIILSYCHYLDLQKDAPTKTGRDRILEDRLSGAKAERPGLKAALDCARQGENLVVWRLDGLSQSLKGLIETVTFLESRDIGLKSLQESIDTSSSSGKLIFQIFGALAEFERNLIRERTHAGFQAARARGRKGGRPRSLDSGKRALAIKLYNEKEHSIKEICKMMGIPKPTLYKYIEAEQQVKSKP